MTNRQSPHAASYVTSAARGFGRHRVLHHQVGHDPICFVAVASFYDDRQSIIGGSHP